MNNSEMQGPSDESQGAENRGPIQHFVTTIKNAEQQVGENILRALSSEGTVAVITTIVRGPDGQQHVVSATLGQAQMKQVQGLLQQVKDEEKEEVMCLGFHCLVPEKRNPE